MPDDEPTRSTIAIEVVIYVLLFVLVGALFVTLRFAREGPRVLNYDVRDAK